jgi:hypothetical protein
MGKGSGGVVSAIIRALLDVDSATSNKAAFRAAIRGAINVGIAENGFFVPSFSLGTFGRQKFNEVPTGRNNFGDAVIGQYGAKMARFTGDYLQINQSRSRIRQEAASQRSNIHEAVSYLNGQTKQDYLDNIAIDLDQDLLDLRDQYILYGTNSAQSRVLDQAIASKVHLLNEVEKLSGYRDADYYRTNAETNRGGGGDYNYIPKDGEFGRRVQAGEMSIKEKADMQAYRDRWKINRQDAYDSIRSGFQSEMDRDYELLSEKLKHNVYQREIYRGTDWKRTLDYEILRDLKVLKALNEKNPTRYGYKDYWNEEYLPNHLRNQL